MCGRYNVIGDPLVQDLLEILGIPIRVQTRLNWRQVQKGRLSTRLTRAKPWKTPSGHCLLNPNPGSAAATHQNTAPSEPDPEAWEPAYSGKNGFTFSGPSIPASGFHEWTGEKGHKQCYNIHPVNSAIAFAGLYELWEFQGDIIPSLTIVAHHNTTRET